MIVAAGFRLPDMPDMPVWDTTYQNPGFANNEDGENTPALPPADDGSMWRPPARTNFLLIGLDQGRVLTDALMVGVYYRDTGDLKLMSIPRDLFTRIPDSRLERMRELGLRPPQTMRINSLRGFGGSVHGRYFLMEQLGEMLGGVHFHYYVEVELEMFRDVVDAIGGVYMDVPFHLFYRDPYQDLVIDIPAGTHRMDGAMAEGLVRFRGYPTADLARNAVQMEFMTQLLRQAATREAILSNPIALANAVIGNVRTNFTPADAVRFLPHVLRHFSVERITTFTMPGAPDYINGASFFIHDPNRLPDVVRQMFHADTNRLMEETPTTENPLTLHVLNGTQISGMGRTIADRLEFAGHTIAEIDIFRGTREFRTRIWVSEGNEALGESLIDYFNNAVVQVRVDIPANIDAVIIVGRGES